MIDADIAAASSSYGNGELNPNNSPLIQAGNNMSEKESRIGRMVLATFVAALGPLSFGYCLGYSSSALLDFENESDKAVRFTDSQGSWFSVSTIEMITERLNLSDLSCVVKSLELHIFIKVA